MPRHLEKNQRKSKRKKTKPRSCRWGRDGTIRVGAVCRLPSATVSPKYNVQLHSRMEYTTFCLFRRDVIVDPEKYFEPRLLEIYIFFYYEMKKNRDAFL